VKVELRDSVEIGTIRQVTNLGFGAAPLGNTAAALTEDDPRGAFNAAWEAGIRYFDTAPWYGLGLSEHRSGTFLRTKPRSDYILSTKVGRLLRPWPDPERPRQQRGAWRQPLDFEVRFDYSYDGVMRSYEDSMQRLGIARVDILVIHDLDRGYHSHGADYEAHLSQLVTGGFQALHELRADGTIGAIGAGVNIPGVIPQFLDLFDLDLFLVAGPYGLLDQATAAAELDRCSREGVSVIIGAPFRFGILAIGPKRHKGDRPGSMSAEEFERALQIEEICESMGVPLAAAALQFPFAHPAVKSELFGAISAEQVDLAVSNFRRQIPAEFWARLKSDGLIAPDAPVPDA
jgi:D-threo-aldose 1-dehydrogenase